MDLQTQAPALRDLLLRRRSELRAEVQAAQLTRQAAQAEEAGARDFKDGAELMQRQQTDDFQATRDLRELQEVDDALSRLDAGRFGDCAACGDAIPAARLAALPSARLCASCQAAQERQP